MIPNKHLKLIKAIQIARDNSVSPNLLTKIKHYATNGGGVYRMNAQGATGYSFKLNNITNKDWEGGWSYLNNDGTLDEFDDYYFDFKTYKFYQLI